MVQLPSVPVLTQRRRERACYYDESPPTSRFLRPRRDPTRYPVPVHKQQPISISTIRLALKRSGRQTTCFRSRSSLRCRVISP